MIVIIGDAVERLPERGGTRTIAGIEIPIVAIVALEASAPIKVELALKQYSAPSSVRGSV
jgi:hypothetical protein